MIQRKSGNSSSFLIILRLRETGRPEMLTDNIKYPFKQCLPDLGISLLCEIIEVIKRFYWLSNDKKNL